MFMVTQNKSGCMLEHIGQSGAYWNNTTKIRELLEFECSRKEYINKNLSYINMMKSSYQLYMKGFVIVVSLTTFECF